MFIVIIVIMLLSLSTIAAENAADIGRIANVEMSEYDDDRYLFTITTNKTDCYGIIDKYNFTNLHSLILTQLITANQNCSINDNFETIIAKNDPILEYEEDHDELTHFIILTVSLSIVDIFNVFYFGSRLVPKMNVVRIIHLSRVLHQIRII